MKMQTLSLILEVGCGFFVGTGLIQMVRGIVKHHPKQVNVAVASWVGSIVWSANGNNGYNPTNATSSDPQFISLVYPKRLGFSGTTASSLGIQPLTFWDDALATVTLGSATIGNARF